MATTQDNNQNNPNNQEQEKETKEQREQREKKENKEVVDRLVRGVNDVFVKEYNYEDLGIDFTIKIRAPNAVEVGKIQALFSTYLGGMNNYASDYIAFVFSTLATIRVVGVDVPEELAKDEDIYNLDILFDIGRDFQQWLDKFQGAN